jgi:hypothetical protein
LGIVHSIGKSWRFGRISKKLAYFFDSTSGAVEAAAAFLKDFKSGRKRQSESVSALEELLNLCEADSRVNSVLTRYGANRETLRGLYIVLLASGAGHWARGHWVAASSLAFAPTLAFLLEQNRTGGLQERAQKNAVALRLIRYFENGEIGDII